MKEGLFTDEDRAKLAGRRREMGLSASALAAFFEVSDSTYRKWENGRIRRCSRRVRRRLNAFLMGAALPGLEAGGGQGVQAGGREARESLAMVSGVYSVIESDSDIARDYAQELRGVLMEAVAEYMEEGMGH